MATVVTSWEARRACFAQQGQLARAGESSMGSESGREVKIKRTETRRRRLAQVAAALDLAIRA